MAEMKTLSVKKRDGRGKGSNRRLRSEALVPGVYYTAEGVNIAVQMEALPLSKMYDQVGRTNVFNLEIDDNGAKTLYPVFVWDAQYHPTKSVFTHVDFLGVDLNKDITVEVPLVFSGVSKGVKMGGKLEVYRERVQLKAKPQAMPRKVEIDITPMEMGSTLRASGLQLPEGVSVVYKTDFVILSVTSNEKKDDKDEEDA